MIKPNDILEAPQIGEDYPEKQESVIEIAREEGPAMFVMQTNEQLFVQDKDGLWWEPLVVDGRLYKMKANYNVKKG